MNNTYIELVEQLKKRKIIAFGCGGVFEKFMLRYPSMKDNISFFIDNNLTGYKTIDGWGQLPVYAPSYLEKCDLDHYIIGFFTEKWEKMKNQVDSILNMEYEFFYYPLEIDYKIEKEISYQHRLIAPIMEVIGDGNLLDKTLELTGKTNRCSLLESLKNKEIYSIPRIPVVLTPKCTLKCKDCNNLMWKFQEYKELHSQKIINSLKAIIQQFDFVPCVELIGGEPFMASILKEILAFLCEEKKVLSIEITTNATVVPNDEIIDLLKNEKVIVRISDYSCVIKQDRFISSMEKNRIHYVELPMEWWISPGGTEKRGRKVESLVKQYYACASGYLCKTLWENKLYPCARAASLKELDIYADCAYVDLENQKKLRERIINFFLAPTCGACDYCDIALEHKNYVEPAIQMQ